MFRTIKNLPWKVGIVKYPFAGGQAKKGVELTPDILINKYKNKNINIYSPVDIKSNNTTSEIIKNCKNLDVVSRSSYLLYQDTIKSLKDNNFTLVVGGDHSQAIGSTAGVLKNNPNTLIIWFDAHPDLNTPTTSISKNMHGMPVSILAQLENLKEFNWIKNKLSLENLLYLGVRDIDPGEKELMEKYNIKYYTSNEINNTSIEKLIRSIDVIQKKYKNIHLSLDIDGIDPKYFPSTGTPVNQGVSIDFILKLISYLKKNQKFTSADLTEVNLNIGSLSDKNKTLKNSLKLINKLLE